MGDPKRRRSNGLVEDQEAGGRAYRASPLSGGRYPRATKAELKARRQAIVEIVAATAPTSVRHTYYVAITQGLVRKDRGKSRSNYNKVQRQVLHLRTRWMRKPRSYENLNEGLEAFEAAYRRDMWASGDILLEVWCESESIAGVLSDVTFKWDVPLLPTRGYSSETFAWAAAENWRDDDRTPVVLYVGDLDKHGKQIEANLRSKLEGFYGDEVEWTRVGITEDQIEEYDLQDLATVPGHWEAEALPPDVMRDGLENAILEYVDQNMLAVHEVAEESERKIIRRIRKVARG